jgi:hypothetical protein
LAARCLFATAESGRELSPAQAEKFLVDGKIVNHRVLGVGITQSIRASISYDGFVHDAHIQCIDESKALFQTDKGTEMNFRDCWMFNIAAYRLDDMLGLHMTPPSVKRKWAGRQSAFTWWVADAMMEVDRRKKKLTPPDVERFNRQMHCVRVIDQLLLNTDRNLQNLLITPDWNLWMIDHTRCFRLRKVIAEPKNLVQCDRGLLARLRTLERSAVRDRLEDYIRPNELDALMSRRDLIVRFFEEKAAAEGEEKVLFDLPPRQAVFRAEPEHSKGA